MTPDEIREFLHQQLDGLSEREIRRASASYTSLKSPGLERAMKQVLRRARMTNRRAR